MIKVVYTNKLDASKQESLFENESLLEAHKQEYPFMYDDSIFDVVESDISAELLKQKNIEKYLKRIQFGQVLMAELATINKEKLESGAYSPDQVLVLKKSLAPIKDFVSEGSLGFAYQGLNLSQDLPADLKQYFMQKISEYLTKE
jgi:hypothetical protein